jgi:hypothetical protein
VNFREIEVFRYRCPKGICRSILDQKESSLALYLSHKDIQMKNESHHLKHNRIINVTTQSIDIKENSRGGEFMYDIFNTLLRTCVNSTMYPPAQQ